MIATTDWSRFLRCWQLEHAAHRTPTARIVTKDTVTRQYAQITWPTDLGFALVLAQAGMWRCAVISANLRPQ
jgi:hypothetical protein